MLTAGDFCSPGTSNGGAGRNRLLQKMTCPALHQAMMDDGAVQVSREQALSGQLTRDITSLPWRARTTVACLATAQKVTTISFARMPVALGASSSLAPLQQTVTLRAS